MLQMFLAHLVRHYIPASVQLSAGAIRQRWSCRSDVYYHQLSVGFFDSFFYVGRYFILAIGYDTIKICQLSKGADGIFSELYAFG